MNVPAIVITRVAKFLADQSFPKGRWRETATPPEGVQLHYHWTGEGRDALEVALATSTKRLSATEARALWAGRHGRSAAPLLTVVLYAAEGGQVRALLCGPSGDSPAIVVVDANQAERLAEAALKESNRHQAAALIRTELEQAGEDLAGLNNRGLLATHELVTGVPARPDWQRATAAGKKLLKHREHELIRALGYDVQAAGNHHILRSKGGNARAIAVFLESTELPDAPSHRLDSNTPVSYALAQADRENLPWVISVKGAQIRLYSTTTSGAVGQRGRAETFLELNLNLLPDEEAGYLPLLFSSSALEKGGSFYEIQEASRTYATGLSERLRERVYGQAVPRLALSIAKAVGGTSEADLTQHYRTALTILFRLLFISYAEDSKLLPLGINGDYTDHSLKGTAVRIAESINANRELGFDNPFTGAESENPDEQQFNLWRQAQDLFKAVDKGHNAWGVPAYNGGLFSPDPATNPVGRTIDTLALSNADFGPALTALTIDRTPDGTVGPIDFRSLSVREFGTIYEGLLESELSVAEQDLTLGKDETYLPARDSDEVVVAAGEVYLHNKSGQRKASGAYFTKPFAVDHLLDKALAPALTEHLERVKAALDDRREADAADMLFDFRVADISMGSGHFLTAVVDRIEAQISAFLAERPIPHITQELDALRQTAEEALGDYASGIPIENASLLRRLIARRCVYGVDINPISVELARVSMWIHTFVPGLPLSFLNHNLVTGDSLSGISNINEAADIMLQVENDTQFGLFNDPILEGLHRADEPLKRFARIVDATPKDVAAAQQTALEVQEAIEPVAALFDVAVAVRTGEAARPPLNRPDDLLSLMEHPGRGTAKRLNSLHFPIAFPEVFLRKRPGFDVIVGNPPWLEVLPEEYKFWTRHSPSFRALPARLRKEKTANLRATRPDLVAAFEREVEDALVMSKVLGTGQFPGMETGDQDLYKAFAWRFWHLVRPGGRIGVVLPRTALNAKGSAPIRKEFFKHATLVGITLLQNRRSWVFEDVGELYTVALLVVTRDISPTRTGDADVDLAGPFLNITHYEAGIVKPSVSFKGSEIAEWNDDAALPHFPDEDSVSVFVQLRKSPRLDTNEQAEWRARPHRELDATNDKKHMDLESASKPEDFWPVYKGESFNLWTPDTGTYYAWADPTVVLPVLQRKRMRGSSFSEFSRDVLTDTSTMPCKHPRIAFRNSARSTDTRTIIAALVPPNIFISNAAPYILMPRGNAEDEAFLLGVLSSIPLDWYARRFVELNVNFFIFNPFPVPRPRRNNPLWRRVVELAGRMGAADERYSEWAASVGVNYGPLPEDAKQDMIHELDAAVALLYGLSEEQLVHIYETFHEGWDYTDRLMATLKHFERLSALIPA